MAATYKTKGAFEGARGAIHAYGSLGSLKSSLSFVCGSHNGSIYILYSSLGSYEWLPNVG